MDLAYRLEEIESRIVDSCRLSGRKREDVTLIAITKTVTVEQMLEAQQLGVLHFGESRLQEALPKLDSFLPFSSLTWHFIGKLQSNKVRKAGEHFSVLHTIESDSQLRELAKLHARVDVLVEVNIAEEMQKSGVFPDSVAEFVENVIQCERAQFRGLMTIGPANRNSEIQRPFFRRLRELNEKVGGTWLSMGMSSDFDVAIQEGATHVRVGSALFGARN